jgi:beta-phosphoglucomutase
MDDISQFEALLFDFDGVLLDSEPVHFACWAEALKPHGLVLDWDTYRHHCIGIDDRSMLRWFAARCDPPADYDSLWAEYPRKREMFRARMRNPPFSPGVTELLSSLHGRYKLAVVSSSGRQEVEPLLELGGMRPYLDAVVCGGDVTRRKPEPDPYLLASKLLNVKRALVVEDSDAGAQSGRAAGFEVLRVDGAERTAELVRARLARISCAP